MNNKNIKKSSLWWNGDSPESVFIIDQRRLPFEYLEEELSTAEEVYIAIKDMHLRGAPLIGGAAVWGVYFALKECLDNNILFSKKCKYLKSARPTAVNLSYAIEESLKKISQVQELESKIIMSREFAKDFCKSEVDACKQIGVHGVKLIEEISKGKNGEVVNILTHCNAGWLACIEHGTATSPIYAAHRKGIKIHVWIDETRPLNQGSKLTSWELTNSDIPNTIIADNTGGLLMQKGMVDLCIVGSDRTTRTGDVANKIGTYLKALAAYDNDIPFYVALPSSTIDFSISDGLNEILIEERDEDELHFISGFTDNRNTRMRITAEGSKALNYGFDVTPSKFVTGLITERGICGANGKKIKLLFPEYF